MSGKTCVVTGANSGIGKETALALALRGARVIMVCRNHAKGEEARRKIIGESGNESIDLLLCDLSSFAEVRRLADEITRKYGKLDVLVNNAGIFSLKKDISLDGFEKTFAVNYFAPFLLTMLLLPLLKKSVSARVVNVSSVAHFGGHLDLSETPWKSSGGMKAYSNSKLALIMFTYELDRRIKGSNIKVNSLHPGAVATNIWRLPTFITRPFMTSAKKGAQTSIYLATSPEVERVSGKYFEKMKAVRSSEESYDETKSRILWETTYRLVGIEKQD